MRRWSRGLLFREHRITSQDITYRYPSGLEAGISLVGLAIGMAGEAFGLALDRSPEASLVLLPGGAWLLLMGVACVRRIWEHRVLTLSLSEGRLSYTRRIPFQTSTETLDFDDLRSLRLDAPSAGPDTDEKFDLFLQTLWGPSIYLGTDQRITAINAARRLSDRLGIPLELPPGSG